MERMGMMNINKSILYKLLNNPQLRGVDFGYEGIMELITLLQNAGFFSEGGKVTSSGLAYLLGEK